MSHVDSFTSGYVIQFDENVNMAIRSPFLCEICQKLRSMTEKLSEMEHFKLERTTVSTIFYVFGVAFVFVVSWISVNLRSLTTFTGLTRQQPSYEMLNFGERSLRFAVVPNPKPSSTETEAGKIISPP